MSNNHWSLALGPAGIGGAVMGMAGLITGGKMSAERAGWDAKSRLGFEVVISVMIYSAAMISLGREIVNGCFYRVNSAWM